MASQLFKPSSSNNFFRIHGFCDLGSCGTLAIVWVIHFARSCVLETLLCLTEIMQPSWHREWRARCFLFIHLNSAGSGPPTGRCLIKYPHVLVELLLLLPVAL